MSKKSSSNSLIKSGIIILIASAIFNITNFFYHFLSARMLGPAEYSIVASLFSIAYLIAIISTTIQNTATKFTADFNAKKETDKIACFFRRGTNKLLIFSVPALILYLILSPFIAQFLKISVIPVLILSPLIILSILVPLNRGILQGLQKFKSLGANIVIEGAVKLISAFILIYIGLKASGAIAAVSIALAVAFILTFPSLNLKKSKKTAIKLESKEIYKFTIISFIALFLMTMIYSIDVFLVKHFFSADNAGQYAVLSLLGKIVFFGATAIGLVMFPKISGLKAEKDRKAIFRKSMLFTFLISFVIVAVYFLFSNLIINIIFGSQYADIIPILGFFGIFMLFFSLAYICVLNKLATGKKRFIWNILAAVILEIILISIFHSSIEQIVTILISLNALLLISLIKP